MSNHVLGVDINVPGIAAAIVDVENNVVLKSTYKYRKVNPSETAERLIDHWAEVITEVHALREVPLSQIGISIPGPFDYEKGISLMTQAGKFEALYNLNVKELLSAKLGISSDNIKMRNNTQCFLEGELLVGAAQGYQNVMAFALNQGLGTARYHDGILEDAMLWSTPFRDGIAEDYLGISWLAKRYQEFTGVTISGVKELADLARTDDGIGQLVFNEYGENFVKFLLQYLKTYNPDIILVGGYSHAWEHFIEHVKNRLDDSSIKISIKEAQLGIDAFLIGAAHIWL